MNKHRKINSIGKIKITKNKQQVYASIVPPISPPNLATLAAGNRVQSGNSGSSRVARLVGLPVTK